MILGPVAAMRPGIPVPKPRWFAILAAVLLTLCGVPSIPAPAQPVRAGDVLGAEPSRFSLDPFGKTPVPGVRATKITYRSRDALNRPIEVTGTVLVPEKPWRGTGPRPLIGYASGTKGWVDRCAPSRQLPQGIDYNGPQLAALLAHGWAVTMTDYEGLGHGGEHTWQVADSEAHTVLDSVRAAQRLPGSGLGWQTPVGIYGYSQGGGAAAAVAEQAASYAPELVIKGVSAGGVPSDWNVHLNTYQAGRLTTGTAVMVGAGFAHAYPELKFGRYLSERGRKLYDFLRSRCLAQPDSFLALLGTADGKVNRFFGAVDPFRTGPWLRRFAENRIGDRRPPMPVLLFHGAQDEIVPVDMARTLRRDWCARGANITWQEYPMVEHILAFELNTPASIDFLDRRFRNVATGGNCGTGR